METILIRIHDDFAAGIPFAYGFGRGHPRYSVADDDDFHRSSPSGNDYGIIKASKCRAGNAPAGYEEYSVYPLEGVWDITEEAKKDSGGSLEKNSFVYKLAIRQPGFVTEEFASTIIDRVRRKNPSPLFDRACFERLAEGLVRVSRRHKEIYLSDPKRTAPEKLKTVLRFQIKKAG